MLLRISVLSITSQFFCLILKLLIAKNRRSVWSTTWLYPGSTTFQSLCVNTSSNHSGDFTPIHDTQLCIATDADNPGRNFVINLWITHPQGESGQNSGPLLADIKFSMSMTMAAYMLYNSSHFFHLLHFNTNKF